MRCRYVTRPALALERLSTNGDGQVVYQVFLQIHPPGQLGLSDFTDANDLNVTIAGAPFSYLLYHFRLAYSGFAHVHIVRGGESRT